MVSFTSDYTTGAHPKILENLVKTNFEFLPGYETDEYCLRASEKIKSACKNNNAQVFFLVGGTQTNQVIISTMLYPNEGVISPKTGHVNAHEAGAIEYTGHKVLTIEGRDGKINSSQVQKLIDDFYIDESHEHMVFPGMVYISFPTEYGTIYTKKELQDLYSTCKKNSIPLFIDGARLGYGLNSLQSDVKIEDLSSLCDVFYIGGTKVGALCGEAVVFTHNNAPKRFVTQIKQHGAMLAKGRLLGVQFDTLFTDNLYNEISKNAIEKAEKMKKLFHDKGYKFFLESPTNQQFILLDKEQQERISKKVSFGYWEKYDEKYTVVRFATSWSTTDEDLKVLEETL